MDEEDIEHLNVEQLKAVCRAMGLRVSKHKQRGARRTTYTAVYVDEAFLSAEVWKAG